MQRKYHRNEHEIVDSMASVNCAGFHPLRATTEFIRADKYWHCVVKDKWYQNKIQECLLIVRTRNFIT